MAETGEGIQRQQALVTVKQIDIAGFKGHGAGHRIRNHFHGHLADRRFVTPVAVVTYQHIILVEFRSFQYPGAGTDGRFDTVLRSPFHKLRRGDKTERARQSQLLQERVVGAFERNLQLRIAERPHVGNLIGELQPGMALPVSQHRLEVGDRGLRIERLAVRKLHIVTQGKEPHFPVCRVAPAGRQPRLDRTILLIFDQRLVHHALGKHLVGGIQMRIQRTHVHRPGGGDVVGSGGGQQRCAGEERQQRGAENRQGLYLNRKESMMILIIHHTSGLTWINVRTESIRISYTHFIIQIVCRLARSRQREG